MARRIALLLLVLLGLALAARAALPRAAQALIGWKLRSLGLEAAELSVQRLDLHGFVIEALRLGAADGFRVGRIEIAYSPRRLLRERRLDSIRVQGLHVPLALDNDGLSLGALDALLQGSDRAAAPRSGALPPVDRIAVDDLQLRVATPAGPLTLSGALRLDAAQLRAELSSGAAALQLGERPAVALPALRLTAALDLSAPPFRFDGKLEVEGSPLRLGAEGTIAPDLSALQIAFATRDAQRVATEHTPAGTAPAAIDFAEWLRLAGLDPHSLAAQGNLAASGRIARNGAELDAALSIRAGELGIGWGGYRVEAASGNLDITAALAPGEAPLLQRLALTAHAGTQPFSLHSESLGPLHLPAARIEAAAGGASEGLPFTLELELPLHALTLTSGGDIDPQQRSARIDWQLQPLRFDPSGLQPAALLPALGRWILAASGEVEAKGSANWSAAGLRGRAQLALRDVAVQLPALDLRGLNGTLDLEGPDPLRTPETQLLAIGTADFGLPLSEGVLRYRLHPDRTLELESARFRLAGGRIETHGRFDPTGAHALLLEVADLDLAELLAQTRIGGLSGTGRLAGRLPVQVREGRAEIRGGVLRGSAEGGWLRYQPEQDLGALGGGDPRFGLALEILRNFAWQELEVKLDGDTRDRATIALHCRGSNPDYAGGHPVELNLNIDSRLADLLLRGSSAYRIPAEIERRLGEYGKPGGAGR